MTRGGAAFRAAALTAAMVAVVIGCSDDPEESSREEATIVSSDATDGPADGTIPNAAAPTSSPDTSASPSTEPASDDVESAPDGSTEDQPEALGPLGSTDVAIDTGEGTVQIGSGELPDAVPDDFPLPADFELQLASETDADAGFSGVTALTFDDLVDFYRRELTEGAYDLVAERLMTDSVAVFEFESAGGAGEVAVSAAPGGQGNTVLVTFSG